MNDTRPPALFVSHGAPTLPLEDAPARAFLSQLGATLGAPRGIVALSAHWETRQPMANASAAPETMHDFSGFPEALYRMRYPAPGDPALAQAVADRLSKAGFAAGTDDGRGIDHGVWVPLMLMYPQARVPVVQVSIQPHAGTAHHHRMGRALRALRDDGVLIFSSGSTTHNLRALDPRPNAQPPQWAEEFSAWIAAAVAAGDTAALLDYRDRAPHAALSHPTDEHLLPFFVALGAGTNDTGVRLHHSYTYGAIAMDVYRFD